MRVKKENTKVGTAVESAMVMAMVAKGGYECCERGKSERKTG